MLMSAEDNQSAPKLDKLVHAEQLELLFQQSFPAIFTSIIVAALLTAILWPVQDQSTLIIWFTILLVTGLIRYFLFISYMHSAPQGLDILKWEKPYFVTLMLTTLTWGIGCVVIMPVDSPIHQLAVLCFVVGMSGGAMSLYSAHRLMTIATIVTVLFPTMIWFLFKGDLLSIELVIGATFFFLSAVRATSMMTSTLRDKLALARQLKDSDETYRLAMEASHEGLWDWDVATGDVYYSPGWTRILGEKDIANTYSSWEERIHPEDKPAILDSLRTHLDGKTTTWQSEHRLRNASDKWTWVTGRGQVVERDTEGKPLRMIGTMTDITGRKQAELAMRDSMAKYQGLVEDIGSKLVVYNHEPHNGELLYVSTGFESIFGISREDALHQPWQSLIKWHPADLQKGNQFVSELIEGKSDFAQFDMAFDHPDGEERTVRVSCHPIKDDSSKVTTINGIVENVTEQKSAQEQVRLLAKLFLVSQNGVIITDTKNRIVDANPTCIRVTGYSREELIGSNPNIFSSGKHDAEFYSDMWQQLQQQGHWQGEIWNRKKTGEIYSEQLKINAIYDDDGKPRHYVAVYHDLSYLKEREAELKQIAFTDVLTGLPNRLLLFDRMQQAILRSHRSNKRIAVCYLDLDEFKPINDNYGHHAGDEVLVEVANRLKHIIRANDTVARIGGDEFVLLLQDITEGDELHELLDRILYTLSQPYDMPFATVSVSASIGVVIQSQHDTDADKILSNADKVMYEAKNRGKNRYCVHTTDMDTCHSVSN